MSSLLPGNTLAAGEEAEADDVVAAVMFRDHWYNYRTISQIISQMVKNNPQKENYSNQIPEVVINNIIKISANDNDIIFDPFMGSGTTPAVASKLNFKYMATDISKKAFAISSKRLQKIENNLFNQKF